MPIKKFLASRFLSNYGSVLVLLLLCAYYSIVTWGVQHPITPSAGRKIARTIAREHGEDASVWIVIRNTEKDKVFAAAIEKELKSLGATVIGTLPADKPSDVRVALEQISADDVRLNAIATNEPGSAWGPLQEEKLRGNFPMFDSLQVYKPRSYMWPSFLTRENLVNVVNQNADVFIIAIGMTLVIITAGIDLSVGSLVALSGVLTAIAIETIGGGANAAGFGLILCAMLGIGVCSLCGAFNGVMVTYFRIPAFVVTLALMEIARGLALKSAVAYKSATSTGATAATPEAVSIHAETFEWLGNGATLGIPHPIILMLGMYMLAHVVMTRTSIGRYIYAVGGNREAARLSGVPVFAVLILVYTICGALAGLAGVLDASKFMGGRPNAGVLYELRVIAAVVVGGTSLVGGEGRVFGTLIGALIIAVIQNGLNMAGVQSFDQRVIFGLLILGAVLLDQLKNRKSTT